MTSLPLPVLAADYGGDANGLICGFWFRPAGGADPIVAADEVPPRLGSDEPGFLWLHMNLSHAGAEPWLRRSVALGEGFHEALHDGSRSTRIQRDGDRVLAVINDVAYDHAFDATDIATLWVSVGERLVVTARRHPLRAIDRLRMAVRRGDCPASTAALLLHLLDDQADELQQVVRRAADRIDDIEDDLLAGEHERHAAELARLRRFMVRLQRLLAPEPGALLRMLANPPAWIGGGDVQRLQRANDDFALVLRDVGSLQERTKLMADEATARVADENNRSLYLLTVVTVLALPINLVSGMFGMNVGGVPFGEHPAGFWIMLAVITGLTGTLALIASRRLRRRRG